MKRIIIISLMFLSMPCISESGTRDSLVPDEKYLSYGEKHKCVLPIYGQCDCDETKTPHSFSASAVAIRPKWVITAAHVVKEKSKIMIKVGKREFRIKRVIVNEKFEKSNIGMYDIALCESEEELGFISYPELYREKDEQGKIASICGYGVTGTFRTGAFTSDGKKRAGANIIERTENHVMICVKENEKRKTNMDFLISHGDSGGGLFINQKLAGVNSFVMASDGKPDSSYGDESGHTRISLFVDWISSTIGDRRIDGEGF